MVTRPGRDPSGRTGAVYWRRRAAALLASLSVLIGLSWAVTWGVGQLTRPGSRPAHVGAAARLSGSTQLGVPDATSARRAAPAALPACPVADIQLRLTASQPSYSLQQLPEFHVDVVSAAGYSCTFDTGARHVLLQISAGTRQVWTSADCAEGLASRLVTLDRGVPDVLQMTWDDQYSTAGCPMPGRAAPSGSYTARVKADSAVSSGVTFRIG
jgi:hypothetical protein